MGTPGWAIVLFTLMGLIVFANYVYETATVATCRHCGDQGVPGTDHSCPCPHPDESCPDHAE